MDTDADWKTQLTKGCRLLAVVEEIEDGYYTAVVELCFGIIEQSLEAFAIVEGGDELRDFQTDSHDRCYDQAARFGLFTRGLTGELKDLYGDNRTDSYYGGRHPSRQQAEAMHRLARETHQHVTDQIREGGVCNCDQ
ncbi:DNA-binding protein [Halomicroarcula sp. F13]|uniref:DNA-binding protein n=1 Tax=Haloarcula rubra TaxID=2487747 RepID=A0AAW4PZ19_9EURY|nr:DNA-binding protein [Halomicroarcula rubra]